MAFTKTAFVLIVLAYPLIVFFGLAHFEVRTLALILLGLGALRLLLAGRTGGWMDAFPHGRWIGLALVAVCSLVLATGSIQALRYYPVAVNAVMFLLFFGSLLRPPTVIERIARLQTPDLPEAGVRYTRKVTMVWSAFFVFNGGMAVYTALGADLGVWAAYNGGLSYVLMAVLFGGEWLIRRRVLRAAEGA